MQTIKHDEITVRIKAYQLKPIDVFKKTLFRN